MFQWMRALTLSSKHERSGHSKSLSFPSVCVWQRNELTTSHRGEPPTRLGCLSSTLCLGWRQVCLNHFKNILKKRKVQATFHRFFTSPLAKRQRPATEEEETYCTLNKLWKFGRRIVKTLCTYFQFNSIKCIIYFQYNNVKIVSFSFYFPFSFIQLSSCLSQPLVSFCPFIVCFLLFYKTYL